MIYVPAEGQYLINFSRSNKTFCISLHYNGSNSFLFVNATKIYQLKAKNSEGKKYALCLGNEKKKMKKKKNKKMKKKINRI